MQTIWIPLYIGILEWSAGHIVYPIEPPRRTRHSIDEWRPLKEEMGLGIPRHSIRYPVYHKAPYSIIHKKSPLHQVAENSETVEVFSSAPPSILGSLSVFGHATVNAREPASRITLKSQRPQLLQEQSEHHPYYRHHHIHHSHDLQKSHIPLYQNYEERPYLYEPSLRPPPREHVAESAISLVPHPHSSSLTPNSYFFETPQPFQPSVSDIGNGYHKLRKPIYKPVTHNPYRLTSNVQLYTSVNPLDQFKTPTHLPTSYEDNLSFERGVNKLSKYNLHLSKSSGLSSYYSRNPFGDIHLSTRRPDVSIKYSNQDRNNVKDDYDPFSQVGGRPFQKPSSFTPSPGPTPQKDFENKPYVTTYPSISSTSNSPTYSSVQPFNFQNYDNREIVSSVKPDYGVTHQPLTDDSYPFTVTTIEVPTETIPETGKFNDDSVQPSKNTWDQSINSQNSYDASEPHHPQVKINSFSGYSEREPPLFLPTPSTDTGIRGGQLQDAVNFNSVRNKPSNTIDDYLSVKKLEDTTEYFTTEVPEITTKPPRQFTKNRRRPVNKHSENANKFSEQDDSSNFKNHRPENHKRRRKPSYGSRGNERNRQSEFKKQRTTTTTQEPEIYEPTLYNNEFSTIPATEDLVTNTQIFTTDISIKNEFEPSRNEYEQNSEIIHYINETPENEVKTLHNHKMSGYIDESLTTPHPVVPLTVMTTTPTTTTTTTEKPETSTNPSTLIGNRLKNKYGSNRPRFSVKDYRERLNRGTSTTTPVPEETTEKIRSFVKDQQDILKNTVRIRGSSQYKPSIDSNSSNVTDSNKRKFKPRVGPSRYRITTSTATSVPSDTTTPSATERMNTFRPSTNRYKPGTGKYYSRYRTSTSNPKEADDNTEPPVKVVIKPKGVFSAKRRPFPLKTRFDSDKDTDVEHVPLEEMMHINHGEIELSKYPDAIRNFENEVAPSTVITKKMDNEPTTTSSEEKENESDLSMVEPLSDPTGLEALRIADLTSSSSNDFHTTGFRVTSATNHRTLNKIAIPTEEPILPLEAFFQTHANKD